MRCLSKELANKLKEGAKRGEFKMEEMFEMSPKQFKELFGKYLPEEETKFVAAQFQKAKASTHLDAMKEWAEATFVGEKKSTLNGTLKKIDELRDKGMLTPAMEKDFMEDAVAQKLGVYVTVEETEKLVKFANELKTLGDTKAKITVDGKDITLDIPSIEYWKKFKDFNDYVESLSPTPLYKLVPQTLMRGMMLLSPKSAITNIVGNSANAVVTGMARRIADNQWSYGGNANLITEYMALARKIYSETGFDISRMKDYSAGRRIWGEDIVTSQGKGGTRKLARAVEDIVFKNLMGKADMEFAAAHFADSAVLNATKMARQKGLVGKEAEEYARKIILDSFAIEPNPGEGAAIREYALKEAEKSTYTDKTRFSEIALAVRRALNTAVKLPVGDILVPFLKVPANALYRAIEGSGAKIPFDVYKLAKGYQAADPKMIRDALQGLASAGLGITGTILLVEALDPDNYVGEYAFTDPSERRLVELEGATYNSIKIGNKWVSLDYLGPFGAAIVGMMTARKYGDGGVDTLTKYFKGIGQQLMKIPGLGELQESMTGLSETLSLESSVQENLANTSVGVFDIFATRMVPALLGDIAGAIDDYERQTEFGTFKGSWEKFKRKIPVARETLEPKMNIFGEDIETNPWWMQLAFGARMKEGKENTIINELNRLSAGGELPTLSNVEYTSARVKELAGQIGEDKFKEAVKWFGAEFKKSLEETIDSNKYKKMTDEEKRLEINRVKTEALDKMLKRYHYKKPKK